MGRNSYSFSYQTAAKQLLCLFIFTSTICTNIPLLPTNLEQSELEFRIFFQTGEKITNEFHLNHNTL